MATEAGCPSGGITRNSPRFITVAAWTVCEIKGEIMCDKCNSHDHSTEDCGGTNPAAFAGYAVNPALPKNWNRVLWCIYGPDCFPTIFCCKILNHPSCGPTVWGYSVYEGEPGFRTLGQGLVKWVASMRELYEQEVVFYDCHEAAVQAIHQLTTPLT